MFISVMESEEDLSDLRKNLPLWKLSAKWIDGCVYSSENFLSKRVFKITPKTRAPPKTKQQASMDQWDEIEEKRV